MVRRVIHLYLYIIPTHIREDQCKTFDNVYYYNTYFLGTYSEFKQFIEPR